MSDNHPVSQPAPSVIFLDASPVFGGAQRSFLTTIRALHARGVTCLVITGSGAFGSHLRDNGIPSCRLPFGIWRRSLPGLVRAASDVMTFRGFLNTLELEDDAIFYANGIQSGLLLTLSIPKRSPLIFHHRDLRCPQMALRKVIKRANTTIVLSDFMLQRMKASVPAHLFETVTRIYNGFDWDVMESDSQENVPTDLATEGILVTFVADMVSWKRHDLFIEAMALAVAREPRLQGLIIGGTRDKAGEYRLRRMKRLVAARGMLEHVRFVGYVDNPLPLTRASAAACALADDEPFGRMAIEAAACGTPLVVLRTGGPAETTESLPAVSLVDGTAESVAEGILAAVKMARYEPSTEWKQRFSVASNATNVYELIEAVGTQS